ncbi:hypothetical protein CRENBAI_025938 [Crenichthys baileyi]|uniref:Uncharacterized protein n=1 Tax=Crenichthys baileyi TaxID=28760 RepID=A0AAV9RBJ1_9TELE
MGVVISVFVLFVRWICRQKADRQVSVFQEQGELQQTESQEGRQEVARRLSWKPARKELVEKFDRHQKALESRSKKQQSFELPPDELAKLQLWAATPACRTCRGLTSQQHTHTIDLHSAKQI